MAGTVWVGKHVCTCVAREVEADRVQDLSYG